MKLSAILCVILLILVDFTAGQNNTQTGNNSPTTHIRQIELWEEFLRILGSFGFGALIGFERELTNMRRHLRGMAGIRTHAVICVGSCLVMLVSIYGIAEVVGYDNSRDVSRMAAQAVSGIGFVGAGAILKGDSRSNVVYGLTSAASLWLVMAMGLAVGCGYWLPTLLTAVLVILSMVSIKEFEHWVFGRRYGPGYECDLTVVAVDKPGVLEELARLVESKIGLAKMDMHRRKIFDVPTNVKDHDIHQNPSIESTQTSQQRRPNSGGQHGPVTQTYVTFTQEEKSSQPSDDDHHDDNGNKYVNDNLTLSMAANYRNDNSPNNTQLAVIPTVQLVFECFMTNSEKWSFLCQLRALVFALSARSDVLLIKTGEVSEKDEGISHRLNFTPRDKPGGKQSSGEGESVGGHQSSVSMEKAAWERDTTCTSSYP